MPPTPDRKPGRLEEDDELFFVANAIPPSEAGAMNYDGTSFKMRDAVGTFDPRAGGSGITEGQHRELDTLVHELDETSYDEVIYSGNNVTQYITWTNTDKTLKIREDLMTYSSGKVSQAVSKQYDGLGVLKEQITEVYAYSGNKVTSVTRTRDL
jgi:hypothetical protein